MLGRADDNCGVFLLTVGEWRILFLNDAGFPAEKYLLTLPHTAIAADVIVKGKHSLDHPGLEEFFLAANPSALVYSEISFPSGQKYPEGWAEMVQGLGISALDQSEMGGITLEIWPDRIECLPTLPHVHPVKIPSRDTLPQTISPPQ